MGAPLRRATTLDYDAAMLHVTSISDELSAAERNTTRIEMDYQALEPGRVTDSNLIVSEGLYDPLGEVLATSLHKGSDGDRPLSEYVVRNHPTFDDVVDRPHYYLQGASTFEFQDLTAWSADHKPGATITLARETRVSDLAPGKTSAVQVTIVFSDGLAREIERKRVSDPGEAVIRTAAGALARAANGRVQVAQVAQRWWVSGRTVFNNKGLPVKAYLPYFSNIPQYEDQADVDAAGLLPPPAVMHYDALDRAIRLDTPKGFFSRNVFRAWSTWQYDEDDTVKQSQYYRDNINNPDLPPDERDALEKAAIFDDTPNAIVLDPEGRDVRRVAMQVEAKDGVPTPPRYLVTRLTLDADDAITAIADPRLMELTPPRDNVQRLLTMRGEPLLEVCVDSGARAALNDIYAHEIRRLDGRGVEIAKSYDRLQRLTEIRVRPASTDPWWTAESLVYGEGRSGDVARNLRGQLYRDSDQAGHATYPDYNIQGQPVTVERTLADVAAGEIDWRAAAAVALESAPLTTRFAFDALRRITRETAPDGRVVVSGYGPSTLLTSLTLDDGAASRPIVRAIEHDASDQRTRVTLGNDVVSHYDYEPTTLRPVRIRSERPDATAVQDRSYAYDPVGNVTRTRDNLRPTTFFRQEEVSPLGDYTTDSIYRLLYATGVQQPARAAAHVVRPRGDRRDMAALENYQQAYVYDDGNNLTQTRHTAASGNWTRTIAIAPLSNRGFPVDGATTDYDRNGNTTRLGGLSGMDWSWRNGLLAIATIERDDGASDGAAYQYDGRGRRMRKTLRRRISATEDELEETVYLGGYQRRRIYRESGGERTLILERHDLRILDDVRYGVSPAADDAPENRDSNDHDDTPAVPRSEGLRCYATAYRWTLDDRARETKDVERTLMRYPLTTLLGSITLELDDAGAVTSEEEYYPYGETAVFAAVSPEEGSLKEYRYVGKERDAASGLYYFGARYYAPWLGRWISADPAGFNDGTNLYLYVDANPVSTTDATGLVKAKSDPVKKLAEAQKKKARAESAIKKHTGSTTKYGKNKLAQANRDLTSAKRMITYWKNRQPKTTTTGAIPTVPAHNNPGGPQVRLVPLPHPGTSAGTIVTSVPSTAYVADLHKTRKNPLSAQDISDVRNYTMIANRFIQTVPGKTLICVATNRSSGGGLGAQAEAIAGKERDLANKAAPGTYKLHEVVGHVPDVAATGKAYSPEGWFAQTRRSNSIVGGGLSQGRVITEYLVKEADGNVYRYI